MSVYTSVWNQICLSFNHLSQNTMCITFGVPVVPLKVIEETIECIPQMRENSHIFQLQGDLVSRLLRFDDISSTNGTQDHDKVSLVAVCLAYIVYSCYYSFLEELVPLLSIIYVSTYKQWNKIRYIKLPLAVNN